MKVQHRRIVKGKGHVGSDKKIGVYYEELCNIKQATGVLNANVVVDAASLKGSPLRECFQWDNTIAAHMYRLEQARHLIRSVHYQVIERGGKEPTSVRAFHLVEDTDESGKSVTHYVTVAEVKRSRNYRAFVVQQAMMEMDGWTARYGRYKALFPVVKAVRHVKKKLSE